MLNFQTFLPIKETLVATSSETCAPTSIKYVPEKGILMPNLSESNQYFWPHSSIFDLQKES